MLRRTDHPEDDTHEGSNHRRRDRAEGAKLVTVPFVLLSLAALAYFTGIGMLIPAIPRFVAGPLGGGDVAVGIVFGIFSVSAVLVRPMAGILGDRRGRRPLLIAGAGIVCVTVLLHGLVDDTLMLSALRLAGGAGEALFFVGMLTTFADLAPAERRGEAMSLASLALYLGIGLGPLAAEALLSRGGFGLVWGVSAATAFAAMALSLRVPETKPATTEDHAATPQRTRWVHPAGLLPGSILGASIVGMAGFLAFVPLHVLDVGAGSAGQTLLTFAAVVVIIRSLGARLPDRLGPLLAMRSALAASIAGLLIVAAWHHPVGLLAGAAVLGIGIGLLTPSVFALAASRVPPSERGQVMATTSAFIDVAFALGPAVMGLVAAGFGRPAVFVTGALVAALGLVVVQTGVRDRPGVPVVA